DRAGQALGVGRRTRDASGAEVDGRLVRAVALLQQHDALLVEQSRVEVLLERGGVVDGIQADDRGDTLDEGASRVDQRLDRGLVAGRGRVEGLPGLDELQADVA